MLRGSTLRRRRSLRTPACTTRAWARSQGRIWSIQGSRWGPWVTSRRTRIRIRTACSLACRRPTARSPACRCRIWACRCSTRAFRPRTASSRAFRRRTARCRISCISSPCLCQGIFRCRAIRRWASRRPTQASRRSTRSPSRSLMASTHTANLCRAWACRRSWACLRWRRRCRSRRRRRTLRVARLAGSSRRSCCTSRRTTGSRTSPDSCASARARLSTSRTGRHMAGSTQPPCSRAARRASRWPRVGCRRPWRRGSACAASSWTGPRRAAAPWASTRATLSPCPGKRSAAGSTASGSRRPDPSCQRTAGCRRRSSSTFSCDSQLIASSACVVRSESRALFGRVLCT
mmetsp:Transcript_49425/g.127506  ORF Transcript_49425/g.127506 Transcript_49425/m.127506 type:complete len:347 (+) Transcript_49425:1274-2314(+)